MLLELTAGRKGRWQVIQVVLIKTDVLCGPDSLRLAPALLGMVAKVPGYQYMYSYSKHTSRNTQGLTRMTCA